MITKQKIEEHQALCTELMTKLPDGKWKSELHRIEFQHAGLNCLLVRNPNMGHWCGYVGVPKAHPDFGKGYDDVEVQVHGGLTYADECQGFICHEVDDEADAHLHWFGFDCCHAWDLSPGMIAAREAIGISFFPKTFRRDDVYRDDTYVIDETKRLAEQLAARAT